MLKGTEKLSKRIHSAEFNNQNLLESHDSLAGKVSLQESNIHVVQIMFKDATLSLLDTFHTLKLIVQNKDQNLNESMRVLAQHIGLEIWTLQKAAVKRLETMEGIIGTDEQGEKVQEQYLVSPVRVKGRDDFSRVLTAYLVISETTSDTKYIKIVKEYKWLPIGLSNLNETEQAVVSYGLFSAFLREMVKTWASRS